MSLIKSYRVSGRAVNGSKPAAIMHASSGSKSKYEVHGVITKSSMEAEREGAKMREESFRVNRGASGCAP